MELLTWLPSHFTMWLLKKIETPVDVPPVPQNPLFTGKKQQHNLAAILPSDDSIAVSGLVLCTHHHLKP